MNVATVFARACRVAAVSAGLMMFAGGCGGSAETEGPSEASAKANADNAAAWAKGKAEHDAKTPQK